jgi:hypothetical protein
MKSSSEYVRMTATADGGSNAMKVRHLMSGGIVTDRRIVGDDARCADVKEIVVSFP